MKVLAIDHFGGDGMLDWLMRCQADGHDVRWHFVKTDKTLNFGKGLVRHVSDWREWIRWADIVVLADNTKYLREIDAWRRNEGIKVVGATAEAAAWELDRKTGQEVFKKAGIPVPPFREFNDYDAAIAYVKREDRAFVSKPSYDEADKSLSYVAKTPADLVYMLERWKKSKKLKGAFILQEKVAGCEMAVGGFFGPHGFNSGWCENWEFKSLMAGDRGPNVGEMGTVVRFINKSKLADKVLRPLADRLHRLKYVGYVDVNCIIDDEGTPWPLEFTMRFGYPTFNIQQALIKGDHVEWLEALASGKDAKPFTTETIATGIVMALPQFPYGRTPPEDVTGVPVYGLKNSTSTTLGKRQTVFVTPEPNIHLCEMMWGEAPMDQDGKVVTKPCLVTAGDYVLVASGLGETVRQSRGAAYRILDRLKAPASPFWRPDIGQRLKEQIPLVQKHGYAAGMTF